MAPPGVSGLTVRIGTDLDALAADLAARLALPVLSALEPEVVVVPTPGIRMWLESRLSGVLGASADGDGICANLEVLLPGELVRRVSRRSGPRRDPWAIGPMTIGALGELAGEARRGEGWGDSRDADGAAAYRSARGAADLFDRLFRWRPDVAEQWLSGASEDARASLLRLLAGRTAEPPPHRALATAIDRLATGDDEGLDLPARIHVFGAGSLPGGAQFPAMLDALGAVRDVSLHLVVPSAARFMTVMAATPRWDGPAPDRSTLHLVGSAHPLLDSWGSQSTDAAQLLAQLPERETTRVSSVDRARQPREASLLDAVQASIRGEPAPRADPDATVWFHGCVGELRQVEVARDAVLHALVEDHTLDASDVIVLCPDLPRFAPFIEAVLGDPQGAPALPYALRDRAVSTAVPLVAAVESVLSLLEGRFPRSAIIDLLRVEAVMRRFEIDEEDVDRMAEWTAATGVRWGLDAHRRAEAIGLPASFEAGTWQRGLDRLLSGIAIPDGVVSEVLGLRATSPGHDLERLGSLCDAVSALARLDAGAREIRTCTQWCDFVRDVLGSLFSPHFDDAPSVEQLQALLAAIEQDAGEIVTPMAFAEYRALFSDRASQLRDLLVSGPGGVTVTSLAPLRNVPFAVVVLLGLDERSLERRDGVDEAFGPERVGDRDARADDRAGLLGAVLSARSRLIVTYDSADLATNEDVPPASALAELREAVEGACAGSVDELTVRHPRHSHGDSDLLALPRLGGRAFSFDRGARARAVELRDHGDGPAPASRLFPAARVPPGRVERAELVQYLGAPQRTFLWGALGARLPREADPSGDELPIELDGLERWRATTELVTSAMRAGVDPGDAEAWGAFLGRWASSPDAPIAAIPGRLGEIAIHGADGVAGRASDLLAQVGRACGSGSAERVGVEVLLDSGDVVRGDVDVFDHRTTVAWTASSSDRGVRVAATVDLLLLTVAYPDVQWRARRIWRKEHRTVCMPMVVDGDSPDEREARARRALGTLVELRRRGLSEPLPLFVRVTMEMLGLMKDHAVPRPSDLLAAGVRGWSPYGGPGDRDDPAVQFCFPGGYDELCAVPVQPDDPVVGLDAGGSRLLTYSLAMLEGLLVADTSVAASAP